MRGLWAIAMLATAAVPFSALAQSDLAQAGEPPEKVSALMVFGNDPCPRSTADEIVVCARLPESERYRVPKSLRNKRKHDVPSTAWGTRIEDLEYVTRTGRPNSCSPVGTFGQTGCQQQLLSQWRAERNQLKEDEATVP